MTKLCDVCDSDNRNENVEIEILQHIWVENSELREQMRVNEMETENCMWQWREQTGLLPICLIIIFVEREAKSEEIYNWIAIY